MKEEEHDQLNLSTNHILHHQPASQQLMMNVNQNSGVLPPQNTGSSIPKVRHIYLEQENVYGRFVPFLLLKDQLHTQIDSTGNTALHHMCSHNSPYLPLYLSTLKEDDPILNRKNNMGHTPLDVAGMYCRREYVELLKEKGAIDDGRVDHWAIQGANIANWSGKVDITKKPLIHWAAFNDLPEVLAEFARQGANMHEVDANNNTPIDLAVLNKSYKSVEVLAKLGYRPSQQNLKKAQSRSLDALFQSLDQSNTIKNFRKIMKLLFVPIYLLVNLFLLNNFFNIGFVGVCFVLWAYMIIIKTPKESQLSERRTAFKSDLISKEINYQSNHFLYTFLMIMLVLTGFSTLILCEINHILSACIFWVIFGVTMTFLVNLIILIYGICTNTTPPEMTNSNEFKHLWKQIQYVPSRNILYRKYKNPHNKTLNENLKYYFGEF